MSLSSYLDSQTRQVYLAIVTCVILYQLANGIISPNIMVEALNFHLESGKKIACQQTQAIDLTSHFPNQPELTACISCQCIDGYIECKRTAPACKSALSKPINHINKQHQNSIGNRKPPPTARSDRRKPAGLPENGHNQPARVAHRNGATHVTTSVSPIRPLKIGGITYNLLHNSNAPELRHKDEQHSVSMPADDPRHHHVATSVFGPTWIEEIKQKQNVLRDRTSTTRFPVDETHDDEEYEDDEDEDNLTEAPQTTTTETKTEIITTVETSSLTPNSTRMPSVDIIKPSVAETPSDIKKGNDARDIFTDFNGMGPPGRSNQLGENIAEHDAASEMEKISNDTVFFVALGLELLIICVIVALAAFFRYCDHRSGSEKSIQGQHTRLSSSCSLISQEEENLKRISQNLLRD